MKWEKSGPLKGGTIPSFTTDKPAFTFSSDQLNVLTGKKPKNSQEVKNIQSDIFQCDVWNREMQQILTL